jgi:membrane protease YdiL (CAAX protease family)
MGPGTTALKTLGLATAGLIAIEGLARWVMSQGYLLPLPGTGLARLVGVAWMVAVVSRCLQGWARMGLTRGQWASGFCRGLVWSAAFGLVAVAVFIGARLMGWDPLRILGPAAALQEATPPLLFLVGGLIAPIAEELYFRGILYGYLRQWGFWPALCLSTFIFTFLHPGAAGVPVTQMVGGVVFAVAYEIEKNLVVPIVIHVLGNLAIFSLPHLL